MALFSQGRIVPLIFAVQLLRAPTRHIVTQHTSRLHVSPVSTQSMSHTGRPGQHKACLITGFHVVCCFYTSMAVTITFMVSSILAMLVCHHTA
jgi:hypothetical protein